MKPNAVEGGNGSRIVSVNIYAHVVKAILEIETVTERGRRYRTSAWNRLARSDGPGSSYGRQSPVGLGQPYDLRRDRGTLARLGWDSVDLQRICDRKPGGLLIVPCSCDRTVECDSPRRSRLVSDRAGGNEVQIVLNGRISRRTTSRSHRPVRSLCF